MNFMLSSFYKCRVYINRIVKEFAYNNGRDGPEICYALNINTRDVSLTPKGGNPLNVLSGILNDGFLWAVPKHRRSLERRMTRRMGFGKMLIPKKNLIVCDTCGHFHPVHTVCGNCYNKVKEETDIIQDAIVKELKLDPIDREVVVLYEDDPKDDKMFKEKRIVELPKERPKWFSRNLLVKDSEIPRQRQKSISSAVTPPTVTNAD